MTLVPNFTQSTVRQMAERVFYQGPVDYNITGNRRWSELNGGEQDDYILSCFRGERVRKLTEVRLGLFDRPAVSIAERLLGPFLQYSTEDGVIHYEPEDDARVARIRGLRQLFLKETPLGNRWREAEAREKLKDVERRQPERYKLDSQLDFDPLDFAQTKGLETLSEASFGGFWESTLPTGPDDSPRWNDWQALERLSARDWERKRVERWDREAKAAGSPATPVLPASVAEEVVPSVTSASPCTSPPLPSLPSFLLIAMLLWALFPFNPYGYYIILRWVCCAVLLYLGVRAWALKSSGWAIALGAFSVVYNPISKVPLTRPIWSVVNVATIVLLLAFMNRQKSRGN